VLIKWSFPVFNSVSASVMGPDGTIYSGTHNGLYAVNPDGTVKWTFVGVLSLVNSTPAIGSDGTIYVGIGGYLYAINPDGTEKWKEYTGWHIISPPTISNNGIIYVGNRDGYVYAIDPHAVDPAARLKWKSERIGSVGYNAPAISHDGGTIYITSRSPNDPAVGAIAALDAGTGLVNWQILTPGGIVDLSSPAVGADGTIYFGSRNTCLYAINPDGSEKWTFKTSRAIDSTPAIGSDGTIYFGSGSETSFVKENYLYAINSDGTLKWKFNTGYGVIRAQVAIGNDGTLYAGDSKGLLYAVNSDGTEKWRIYLSYANTNGILDTPVIGPNGTLYIHSYFAYGRFFAIGGTNNPPVADAGPNIALESYEVAGSSILGTATDPDTADIFECQWKEDQTVLHDWSPAGESGACNLDLGSTGLQTGTHTLTLLVSDGHVTTTDSMVLIIANSAPSAAASGGGTYELFTPITVGGEVSDYDGDTLTYEWLEGEDLLFSGQVTTTYGSDPVALPEHFVSELALGVHMLTLRINDGVNPAVSSNIVINIIDGMAPTLQPISSANILWPPNHQMVDIRIDVNAADNSGLPVAITAEVASNELIEGLGDGDTAPDWTEPWVDQAAGIISLQLRAERGGSGSGRVYFVTITATDPSGNSSQAIVEIIVPHDKRGR
jgi:outer membrane protein assembly factor BamB